MQRLEFEAGPNQVIVVYTPNDTGKPIDAAAVCGEVAADAKAWASNGWRILSTAAIPTHHTVSLQGREGFGYETQAAIMIVYSIP